MAFLRLENCLRIHGQLSAIKRRKVNPVVSYDNSINFLTAVEVKPHVSQCKLTNTSRADQYSGLKKNKKFVHIV